MQWTSDAKGSQEFDADVRYPELLKDIANNKDILIACIAFCDNKYLCESEYILRLAQPNIIIKRIYFDNNPVKCKINIENRDKEKGGYWEPNKEGHLWYYGEIFADIPLYEFEIKKMEELSKTYKVPKRYTPLKIQTKQKK